MKTEYFKVGIKMKKRSKRILFAGICFVTVFVLWTVLVCLIDVENVGPRGSFVGFSTLNKAFHGLMGVHMSLYTATDWLGIVPFVIAFAFGVLGFVQLCKRKSLFKVDKSILVLGGFYIAVMLVYIFFEYMVVNYRPVLINGCLEASYPSSTTMLAACVMPACQMELDSRIKSKKIRVGVFAVIYGFTAFMVIGRLISGVHWLSDIIGGMLISIGLVLLYRFFAFNGE